MKPKLDQRLSIRGRLNLLLLASALPFGLMIAASIWHEAGAERERAGARMAMEARLAAARLDDQVNDIRQALGLLAELVETDPAALEANQALLRRLESRLPASVTQLGIWDADGRNTGLTRPGRYPPLLEPQRRTLLRAAAAAGDMVVEAPVRIGPSGSVVAVFAMPIVRRERFVGMLTAEMRIEDLQALLVPERRLPPNAVVTVLNERGIVVYRSIDGPAWLGRPMRLPGPVTRPVEGQRDGRAGDGLARIGGVAASRAVPWTVYMGVPTANVLGDLRARAVDYMLIGGAVLLFGVGLAAWLAKRISAPLQQLGDDAVVLEGGNWAHRSTVQQRGEIGRLARLLNRMADALQQRTALLVASESKLREITDNLPAMITYIDAQRHIRFVNRAYCEWLGMPEEALVDMPLDRIFRGSALEAIAPNIEAALAGQRVTFERVDEGRQGLRRLAITMIPDRGADDAIKGLFVLLQDVTESRVAVERQAHSERRLTLALEGAGSALIDWDVAKRQAYLSANAAAFRGEPVLSEGRFRIAEIRRWLHPDDRARVKVALRQVFAGAVDRADIELRIARLGGDWTWVRLRGRVVERAPDDAPLRFAGTCSDITRRKLAEERLQQLANYDALTGLPNRLLFADRLAQAMARRSRTGATITALLYIDIDRFKSVNDTLGHEAGDRLLIDFAKILTSSVRSADTVARLGGDEFTVILENLQRPADARTVAQALVEKARRTVGVGALTVRVSASVGIAVLSAADADPAEVIRRADEALYEAKRGGRDRIASAPLAIAEARLEPIGA